MAELNNNQIETLRLGLERAFVNFDRLDLFLQEKLGERLNSYAGREDAFPIAIFKLITEGAEAKGWTKELVRKAYQARPKNKNFAEIAAALGVEIELEKTQSVSERLKATPNAPKTTLDQVEKLISERMRQFFGRDDQLLVLDRFVSENDRGVMIVTAPGGFGKSALLANWGRRQESGGALVASHFFNAIMHRTVQAADALKGIVYQIAVLRDAELPDPADDLEDRLNAELCKDASADAPLIVVLDGLDEAAQIIEPIMPAGLGKHVYIVASGRAEDHDHPRHIASWLYAQNTASYPVQRFPLKPLDIAGVMQWLHERVPNLKDNANAIARRLLATTEGIPLYLRFIVDDIRQQFEAGTLAKDLQRGLLALPAPFTHYAAQQLDAMRKLQGSLAEWLNIQRIFALLTLIRGAMPASEIAAVLGMQADVMALDTCITRWFAIRPGEKEGTVAFLHPRLAEVFHEALVRNPQTQGLVHQVERRLIDYCAAWQTNGSTYGLTNLPWHLMQAGEVTQAFHALTSIDFQLARVGHARASTLITQSLADFTALAEAIAAPLKSVARSWLSFWAMIEPGLLNVLLGPRPQEAKRLLLQSLRDTLGAPSDAISQAEKSQISWRQLAGRRAPSNLLRTLNGHSASVLGALALADGRLLSWSDDTTLRLWAADGAWLDKLEGHSASVLGALALADGRLLSWSDDTTLRLWAADGAPLNELKGHSDRVLGALALADGRLLSWSGDNTLRLWAADGASLNELKGHSDRVLGALALADGRLLSCSYHSLRLWAADGAPLNELKGHSGWVLGALALADGRLLSWSTDNTLRIWAADGAPLKELKGHSGWVSGALALADGRLVSWSYHSLRLWAADGTPLTVRPSHADGPPRILLADAEVGPPFNLLVGHSDRVLGALALADGRLLSWSKDKTLRLWAADGASLNQLKGHSDRVLGALALADGRLLSWSKDNTLRIWAADGAPLNELKGHTALVLGALRLADGRLLSWSVDNTLRLWAADGAPLNELKGHTALVLGALTLADGRLLSWSDDHTLRLWAADGAPLNELKGRIVLAWSKLDGGWLDKLEGHSASVLGALALADGRLLSWSDDHTSRLWAADGAWLDKLEGHSASVLGALALADGRLLSWSDDTTLRLWAADGAPLNELKGHRASVLGALALADGRLLSWSGDNTLRLWAADGASLNELKGHSDWVLGALALADGRLLSWSKDNTLRIWAADGAPLNELKGHSDWVGGALALADNRLLSASKDNTLRLWGADGAPLNELKGHSDWVLGALALADGRLLSWSKDNTLRLWSSDGAPLGELKGHTDWVYGALALADGRLLSWSDDNTLRLWAADGAPLQPWLWPYAGLTQVIPHATLANHFWVLAGNDVLLMQLCA